MGEPKLDARLRKLPKEELVQLCLRLSVWPHEIRLAEYVRDVRMVRVEREAKEASAEYDRLSEAAKAARTKARSAVGNDVTLVKQLQLHVAAEKATAAEDAAWARYNRLMDLQIELYDDPWKGL